MGRMIDGAWHAGKVTEDSKGGAFERQDTGFRDWLTPVAAPAQTGSPAVRRRLAGITSMSAMPAPGRTAR